MRNLTTRGRGHPYIPNLRSEKSENWTCRVRPKRSFSLRKKTNVSILCLDKRIIDLFGQAMYTLRHHIQLMPRTRGIARWQKALGREPGGVLYVTQAVFLASR